MGVRRESVELSLTDRDFTTGMAKAAASAALLNGELGRLDGNSVHANRSTSALGDGNGGIRKTGDAARQSSADIDKYSGRLGLLTKAALALGPALVPVSAAAIPAIAGLTMGFGAAAGAAGVAVLAFNGVGDAVKAMDAYALQPTAANLAKMQQAMQNLGPAGANFARFIDGLEPQLRALQGSAREGLLPGVQEGIEELLPLLPKVQDFVERIGSEMGNLATEAGKGLASDAGFQKFARYIDTEGVPIMDAFAKSTGKVASGLVALAADMAPLIGDFMGGMEHAADSFQKWAAGLDQTQGFRDFVTYVEQEGPRVVDLLKSVASTALSIAEAFAPIGSVTLPVLTAVAKVIGLIAKSPLGPVIATVVSLNAAIGLGTLAVDKLAFAWKGVAASAVAAADAEKVAAASGGKGKLGTLALTAAIGASLIPAHETESGGLDSANLTAVGSKLAFVNPSIEGRGQGTLNKIFGTADALTGLVGHTSDVTTERNAASSIDQQLAGLVSGGQADQAAKAFAKISAAAKDSGASVSQVAAAFPHYTAAVKAADAASKSGADSTTKLTTSAKGLTAQFREGTISLSQYRAGLASVHQEALNDFDAVTQFGAAVQAASKQAKDGARAGLNPFTAAGNANRVAVSQMVAAWNQQPAAIQNNIGKYQQMKAKLVEFMTQMGATKAQIRDLTSEINKPRKLVVQAETAPALHSIATLQGKIDALHGKTVSISTNYTATYTNGPGLTPDIRHKADGGYISGPGGPRDDSIPARLSNGEFVVNAATTARLRPWLEHENAKGYATGGLVGYAKGGPVIVQNTGDHQIDRSLDKLTVILGKHMPAAADKAIKAIEKSAKVQSHQNSIAAKVAAAQADRDKTAASTAKDHRDAVVADMASIQQSIAARYQSDVFGKVDSSSIAYQIDPVTGKYVDSKQSSVLQLGGITAGLQKDIADAQAAKSAEASIAAALKKQGLGKSAIDAYTLYMEQNASVGQMQALASNPAIAAQQAQLYTQRQSVSNATGAAIANQIDGKALQIAQQQYDLARRREVISDQRAKQAAQRQRQFDQRMTHIETSLDSLATEIGREINIPSKKGK